MNRIARAALEIIRLALARDTLGESTPAAQPAPRRPHGVLHVLFVSTEPLGEEPPAPRSAPRPILRWIFGVEELPLDPERPTTPPRRSWLGGVEELPLDPEPPARPRRGWLSALLGRETLDDSP